MNKFKEKIFRLFEKNEKLNNDIKQDKNNLEQPDKLNSDNKPSRKINVKKLIWILVILGVIGIIIGVIVGLNTRQTSVSLNNISKVKVSGNNLVITDNNKNYNVDLNNPNSLVQAYYAGVSNKYDVWLKSSEIGLPIVVRFVNNSNANTVNWNIGSQTYIWTGANTPTGPNNVAKPKANTPTGILGTINPEGTEIAPLQNLLNRVDALGSFPPAPFNWVALVSILLPIATTLLLFWLLSSTMRKQMGGLDMLSKGQQIKNTKSNVRFSDVAGISEVKDELLEIVDYMRKPSKYASMGARCPKGLILYGPPGTGKTLIAKAVAGEANCNFFPMAGSAFEDMLVGVGAKRVRELFEKARKEAPSIIFIDEIDSVASKRGSNSIIGSGGGVADQTINQLLAEMDGFGSSSGVTVIAATNRLDVLDEAILRPGRFDRQIRVNLPDISEREEILKIHARNKNLSSKVNLLDIARRTPGFSGAQLENVLNEATLLAVRENKNAISMQNLDEAIDRTIGGPKRKIRVMTEQEKEQISYHEAGHALVGLYSDSNEIVQKITIIPRGNAAGYTLQTPKDQEKQINTKKDLLNIVRMTLGGRAAEELIYGEDMISTGASNDFYKVTNIVRSMVAQLGMTDLGLTQFIPTEGTNNAKQFSEETNRLIDRKIEEIIQEEYYKAKQIIRNNKEELDLIVETLLVLETILKDQIDYIHKHKKLPEEAILAKQRLLEAKKDSSSDSDDKDNKEDDSKKDLNS